MLDFFVAFKLTDESYFSDFLEYVVVNVILHFARKDSSLKAAAVKRKQKNPASRSVWTL